MFSMNRVFIAFFLQGIIYIEIIHILQSILDKPLSNGMIIFVLYFMLFIPNLIYATVAESLQRYIKNYISFGVITAVLGTGISFIYNLLFGISNIKKEALLGYFITYFIVSIYLKYLYMKSNKSFWRQE